MPFSTYKTLLVVDALPENLPFLGELLRPAYRVQVAGSRRKVRRIIASRTPLDLVLPDAGS